MTPRKHQIEGAEWAIQTIRQFGLAYLSWQERTGKTLTALLTVENSKAEYCLIITKKKAILGWEDTLKQWNHETEFFVINYESAHKVASDFDFIILDEAHHAISGMPKRSRTWQTVKTLTKGKPILYLSATPYAEHLGLIYHQFKLSDWTPFPQNNFYNFFRKYGISKMTRTPYGLVETYSKYKDEEILDAMRHLFNFKTRADVGIEVEPGVQVIKIPMLPSTKKLIKEWVDRGIITINGKEVLADSDMKKRIVHYQIEGSTIKIGGGFIFLPNKEKINYIKENYDSDNTAVMAHFVAERELIESNIPGIRVLSADGDAEGIDLSNIDKLIVYSMSFKTSKHTQRIARQANHNREKPILVDILVMDKPGIGMAVYKTVAIKKENFVKNSYDRISKNI